MICPKCNNKLQVKDVVNNIDEREVYRKLKCNICDKIYYSCEILLTMNVLKRNIMIMTERNWQRLKNPCSKYCEDRNSECRLTCQKFKDWQVEHNKLKEEIDMKRDIDISLTKRDMIRSTYKIRRNK